MNATEYLTNHPAEALRDVAEKLYPDAISVETKEYDSGAQVLVWFKDKCSPFKFCFRFNPIDGDFPDQNKSQRIDVQDAYRKDLIDAMQGSDEVNTANNKKFLALFSQWHAATESATTQLIAYMELHGINGDKNG